MAAALIALSAGLPTGLPAQQPATPQTPGVVSRQTVTDLIEEVRAQQKELEANQTAIDERIAAIAELLRQARLFSARRGGSGGGAIVQPAPEGSED